MKNNFILIIAVAVAFASCQKKATVDYSTLGQDSGLSQSVSSDIFQNVDNQAKNNGSVGKTGSTGQTQSTCATVTLTHLLGSFPDTLIIDFGTGCTDINGVTRSGQLICSFTGKYTDAGTVVSVNTNNYVVNGYGVQGTKIITNDSTGGNGNVYFTVSDQNGKVTKPNNGGVATWTSSYSEVWMAGQNTPNICDDVYSITGYASGVDSKGDSYTLTATQANPLIADICCDWLQSGILYLFVNSVQIASVDYSYSPAGSSCDSWVTLTYGGKNYNVNLY